VPRQMRYLGGGAYWAGGLGAGVYGEGAKGTEAYGGWSLGLDPRLTGGKGG
jgi:hypothetical protein